ncbi:MAG: hypothetical protein ACLVJ6_16160 [Merdibacter sp.]
MLMMLLVYLQLVSFSWRCRFQRSPSPWRQAVSSSRCADMALLPLLQRLFLHAQEEQLSRMYGICLRLRSRMMGKRDGDSCAACADIQPHPDDRRRQRKRGGAG